MLMPRTPSGTRWTRPASTMPESTRSSGTDVRPGAASRWSAREPRPPALDDRADHVGGLAEVDPVVSEDPSPHAAVHEDRVRAEAATS